MNDAVQKPMHIHLISVEYIFTFDQSLRSLHNPRCKSKTIS